MRNPTGQLIWREGKPVLRIPIGDKRPFVPLRCRTEAEALERVDIITDMIVALRETEKAGATEELVKQAAKARSATELEGVRMAVKTICEGQAVARPQFDATITFKQFAEKWYTGALHELYPRFVNQKKTSDQDKQFLSKWVFPEIGDVPLLAVTIEHCEDVLNAIPQTKSAYVARHVAQVMRRVFDLAVYPAKLLEKSPVRKKGFLPKLGGKKARTYLYVDEDRKLLGCTEIYLVLRLLYGMLAREGFRIEEALTLDFVDLDLEHGIINLDRNKTDDPRAWALDPSVAEALRLWKKYFHPKPAPSSRVFVYPAESRQAGEPLASATRAEELRANLRRAGCRRHQLFQRDADRRPICIHDLRATFITISLAHDKTEAWVMRRTGHKSSKMIKEYSRQAQCHADVMMGVLHPLVDAIPELRAINASLQRQSGGAAA
jgi:integrase